MSITNFLFWLARLSADVNSLKSGKTARRRVKNKLVGRSLARAGFWRFLWK